MKDISIIIPFYKGLVSIPHFIAWVNSALNKLGADYPSLINNYEIIFITNNQESVTLQDIETFPENAPVQIYIAKELKGIADLSLKGISLAKYEYIGIVDAHADYPPLELEKIVMEMTGGNDVVAAFKTTTKSTRGRNSNHRNFSTVTNHFLFQLRKDPQSGALFFSKSVWEAIRFKPESDALFSIEFLVRAQEAGFTLRKYNIYQTENSSLPSPKFSIKKSVNAARDVLSVKLKEIAPIYLPATNDNSMTNAGLRYKKQKYITHTTLNTKQSAIEVLDIRQLLVIGIFLECLGIGFVLHPLLFIQTFIAVLSSIYLIDVVFNLFLVLKTVRNSSELSFTKEELDRLRDDQLPIYSILCPLYKEVHILPQFLAGIEKISWPKHKLDVILLLEEDDKESINAFEEMDLPSYIRAVIVPHSMPKTKPKACNYGLAFAKGKYTVIFDAEDLPDPMQLKKAHLGFESSKRSVVCLQAKLSYYNVHQNLLTRFFTAEYSLWFGMTLGGLQSLNTTIPLGGTSNHFRTDDLKKLFAWDPFNVTEDADLGMRLFKLGYQTAMLDSVTLEEGNSNVKNWIRQRSRWIKGYMQTYLVHTRESVSFVRERGIHAILFQLIIGGKIAFIFINPILWTVTLSYFLMYSIVGPTIDSFYPQPVLYIAITSLIFGNYLYLFCHIMGCIKNNQWGLIKYIYLIPIYWVLISVAGMMALWQLLFKPFYWEKTVHGLHLKKKETVTLEPELSEIKQNLPGESTLLESSI